MKDLEHTRLAQARESLDDARALLAAEMDTGRVLTNLYYAFYYPVLALLNEGKVPEAMQSVTIGLFERQFVDAGVVKKEHLDALRMLFDSKPNCSGEKTLVHRTEIERLLSLAQAFQGDAERLLAGR